MNRTPETWASVCYLVGMPGTALAARRKPGKRGHGSAQEPAEQESRAACSARTARQEDRVPSLEDGWHTRARTALHVQRELDTKKEISRFSERVAKPPQHKTSHFCTGLAADHALLCVFDRKYLEETSEEVFLEASSCPHTHTQRRLRSKEEAHEPQQTVEVMREPPLAIPQVPL